MVTKVLEHPSVAFLKSLYQHCDGGFINLRFLHKDRDPTKTVQKFIPLSEIESIPKILKNYIGQYHCYFAVAARIDGDGSKNGIIQIPVLWTDLDLDKLSDKQKEESRLRYRDFPLKPAFNINSGGGRYLLWMLREPTLKEEISRVENFLKRLASYFHGDPASTDASRILRIPGTRNYKYSPVRFVSLKDSNPGLQYNLDDFDFLPEVEGRYSINGEAIDKTEALQMVMECSFLNHCDQDRATLSEPAWYTMISILCRFPGHRNLIHSLSKGYPKYNPKETDEKILHAIDGSGPITCDYIKSLWDCGKDCGVKSPASLTYQKTLDSPGKSEEKKNQEHHFNLIRAKDIVSSEEPETSWIWEGILPAGGLSLVVAKPKVGKTTLAFNLALAISRGETFLGRKTQQGNVVYLALEEKKGEIQKNLAKRGITDEPFYFHVGPAPLEATKEIEPLIKQYGAKFLVIDILQKFCRVKDLNDYSQVTRALEPILASARRLDCHIQLLHHAGKRDREDGDDILGSTGLLGGVDTSIHIKKRDKRRTFSTIQRYGGEGIPETVISLQVDGSLEASGSREEVEIDEARQAILGNLDSALTEAEICERVGKRHEIVSKSLRKSVEIGEIKRSGNGKKGDPYRYEKNSIILFPTYNGKSGREFKTGDNTLDSKENFTSQEFEGNASDGGRIGRAFLTPSLTENEEPNLLEGGI